MAPERQRVHGESDMEDSQQFIKRLQEDQHPLQMLPSKRKAHQLVDDIIAFLFPIRVEPGAFVGQTEIGLQKLRVQLHENLFPLASRLELPIATAVDRFFLDLPATYEKLLQDAKTMEQFDPAASSLEEVIVAYPGFYAIAVHRLAHQLVTLNIPILPRMISEYAHMQTGIDIHPGATIGSSFFIDHGTGIVVGETATIGNNVKIYQGVTLGALNVRKDQANVKRHPTIEDNVIVYSGTTILGGKTVIGHDSIIGGNVWLTESVLPYSVVYHKSEVHVRNEKYINEPSDFVI
jgi:serine O-acetyltransferase